MNATPGPILPKICDWMLNKNYESHTRSQTIGNCFQFPSFCHRVKAITRESRTLPIFLYIPYCGNNDNQCYIDTLLKKNESCRYSEFHSN